jgi:hypothetical protein
MSALEDDDKAYRTLLLPQNQGDIGRESLLKRGFTHYVDEDGNDRGDRLLADVERFGLAAMQFSRVDDHSDIFTDEPGRLATIATLATICLKHHPRFKDHVDAGNSDRVQPLHDVREYYQHNVVQILKGRNDLLQDIAETIYEQPRSDEHHHPGRVCSGIEYRDELDTHCFKINILAASPKCIVRDDDGEIRNSFKDRTLYVPLDDIDEKYNQYLETGFKQLVHALESMLDHERIEWLVANESRISEKIDRDIDAGRYDHVWVDWEHGERKIRVLKNAVKDAPDDLATIGEFLTAKTLYEVLTDYEPNHDWEKGWIAGFGNVQSVAQSLSDYREHRDVEVVERSRENHYKIKDTDRGVDPLDASHVEDLFELPCFSEMEEHLHENGPTRKDLWNFVRTAWWLSTYYSDRAGDETLGREFMDDIHETFDRWEWYDPDKTEYQTRYEIEHGDIEGNIPRPRNCDHEDLQRYCIGQDICPYSIYGSLPFPEEMYRFLDEDDPGF